MCQIWFSLFETIPNFSCIIVLQMFTPDTCFLHFSCGKWCLEKWETICCMVYWCRISQNGCLFYSYGALLVSDTAMLIKQLFSLKPRFISYYLKLVFSVVARYVDQSGESYQWNGRWPNTVIAHCFAYELQAVKHLFSASAVKSWCSSFF